MTSTSSVSLILSLSIQKIKTIHLFYFPVLAVFCFFNACTLKVVLGAHAVKTFIPILLTKSAKLQAHYLLYTQFAIVKLTFLYSRQT